MKRNSVVIFPLIVMVVLAAMSAFGQDQPQMKVNVPFTFSVGDTQMQAGEYKLVMRPGSPMVAIRGANGNAYSLAVKSGEPASAGGKFMFQRYGNRYFLKAVHIAGATPLALPQSSAEKEIMSRASQGEVVAVVGF